MKRPTYIFALALWCVPVCAFAGDGEFYLRQVKPLLAKRCYACHGALKQESDLRLDTAAFVHRGGSGGAIIKPGKPAESELLRRLTAKDKSERMPPEGHAFDATQIKVIRTWIQRGAKAPPGERPEDDPRRHWSFRRPQKSRLPSAEGGHNALDAFLAQSRKQLGVKPNGRANRRVLVRRVFLNVVGLPPTPQQVREFITDNRPGAYQRLVERVLALPQYGERWGRHWMDVWRYSDWYGRRAVNDVRNSYPEIWRWRDWIVRSLNQDKGYGRMVQEMLAADEIAPTNDEAIVATGYLVRSWFSLNYDQWMKDLVEHTGKAFLALRFNCAHCHDHKYDPISQEDYFRLRAVFEPLELRHDQVPGGPPLTKYKRYTPGSGASLSPIRAGIARIFDEHPDAKTYMYRLGDARNRFKRPPLGPGVPQFLNGKDYKPTKITLPLAAYSPGLKKFVADTQRKRTALRLAQANAQIKSAQQTLAKLPATTKKQKKIIIDPWDGRSDVALWKFEGGRETFLKDAGGNWHLQRINGQDPPVMGEATKLSANVPYVSSTRQGAKFQQSKDYAFLTTAQPRRWTHNEFTLQLLARFDVSQGNFNRTIVAVPGSWMLLHRGLDSATFELRLIWQDKVGKSHDVRTAKSARLTLQTARSYYIALVVSKSEIGFHVRDLATERIVSKSVKRRGGKIASPNSPLHIGNSDETGRLVGTLDEIRLSKRAWSANEILAASGATTNHQRDDRRTIATRSLRAAELLRQGAQDELRWFEARVALAKELHDGKTIPKFKERQQQIAKLGRQVRITIADYEYQMARLAREQMSTGSTKAFKAADARIGQALKALSAARALKLSNASLVSLGPVYTKTSSGRRRALAEWIASTKNPLTARVAVNHIWMRHFGRPLVQSVLDFGRSGKKPQHPKLLDWLAVELMENDWSMKHLHRLILTSATYQLSSQKSATQLARDKSNTTLWRFPSRRLEAEAVRDSMLSVASELDMRLGGKDIPNQLAQTSPRRGMYFSIYPEAGGMSQFGTLFDAPDPCDCYRRFETVVPQQSLALTNSRLARNLARRAARHLLQTAGKASRSHLVKIAFEQMLSRPPNQVEEKVCVAFLDKQVALYTKANKTELTRPVAQGDVMPASNSLSRAYESLVRALYNHTDFITIP